MPHGRSISATFHRVKIKLLIAAVVVALVAVAIVVYPAWSARRGDDARWVVASTADRVVDFDADRVLLAGGHDGFRVLDRATGATMLTRVTGADDYQSGAALVPGGVVVSTGGRLRMIPERGGPGWQQETAEYVLVAVTDAVVVAAVKVPRESGPRYALAGFALADGAPVWTVPDLSRVGFVDIGVEPARPPGALRRTSLVAVLDGAGWHLVAAGTGKRVADVPDVAVPTGDLAVVLASGADTRPAGASDRCADFTLAGPDAVPVTWPDDAPDAECGVVWAFDDKRVLLIAPREDGELTGNDQAVRLFSVAPHTGKVTGLDWRGVYTDLINENEAEIARSWGRYLALDGTVYDTDTGRAVWRGNPVWLGDDTAVTTSPVSALDRLAPGVTGDSLRVHVADAATGEPTGDEFITDDTVRGVSVLDRGQAVVFAGGEAALLSR